MKTATLRDVAREAGVSVSTASRVLNGQPFVSDGVRERVLLASEQLGYRPDVAARSMRTGTTGAVGLIVSDISNPLFASIARAADHALSPRGYALMVANSANDAEHEAELIAAFRQRRLDGLMIAAADEGAAGLAKRVDSFQAAVLLDREVQGSRPTPCSPTTRPGSPTRSGIWSGWGIAGSRSSPEQTSSAAAACASRPSSRRSRASGSTATTRSCARAS